MIAKYKYSFSLLLFVSLFFCCKSENSSVKDESSKTNTSEFDLSKPVAKDSIILDILENIKKMDGEELESLRDDIRPEHKMEIAKYWDASLPSDIKDGFVHIFMDQTPEGISHIFEDGLNSDNLDNRTISLGILLGPGTDIDQFYKEDGGLDIKAFMLGVKKYHDTKDAK